MRSEAFKKLRNQIRKTDYEVGYGVPPEHSKFKEGKSGNPKGRPLGAKNKQTNFLDRDFLKIIKSEADRPITINERGEEKELPTLQAATRSLFMKAMKGNVSALRLAMELFLHAENEIRRDKEETIQLVVDYKHNCEQETKECKRKGLTPPKHLPNPDHLIIDFQEGTVSIEGPVTKEQLEGIEFMTEYREATIAEIESSHEYLSQLEDPKEIAAVEKEIESSKDLLVYFIEIKNKHPNYFEHWNDDDYLPFLDL